MTVYRLAAYLDLNSSHGPLHARAVADTGRCYLAGLPLPPYQFSPSATFRAALAEEAGERKPVVRDPRYRPAVHRSAAWQRLCTDLDAWQCLSTAQQLDVSTVLARLGFWTTLAGLPLLGGAPTQDALRLAHRRCVAQRMVTGGDPEVTRRLRSLLRVQAEDDSLPLPVRLGAAVNLVVEHARSAGSPAALAHWQSAARALVAQAPPGTFSDILLSAYWRGLSFVPFHHGDHDWVREMLDAAERLAHAALRTARPERRLLARENHRLVLMTRARAAQARGCRGKTEHYLRAAIRADPRDPVSHVQLADFLVLTGRLRDAQGSYRRAAALGAPCTAYARAQAVNCRTDRLIDVPAPP